MKKVVVFNGWFICYCRWKEILWWMNLIPWNPWKYKGKLLKHYRKKLFVVWLNLNRITIHCFSKHIWQLNSHNISKKIQMSKPPKNITFWFKTTNRFLNISKPVKCANTVSVRKTLLRAKSRTLLLVCCVSHLNAGFKFILINPKYQDLGFIESRYDAL